ncbi:uncharacterized protein LOC119069826 [Bradysia coprophila]|uniref:uncharacterized protein LOC119069826 n=1 Tax=Bradysia coprophila TaxID=38358 RepID=UPI00187DB2E3|nr:uncharacterized protein LOC119069826 [Bradysia coprophila]
MKFIFVVAIVSVFLQILPVYGHVDLDEIFRAREDHTWYTSYFDYELRKQFMRRIVTIVRSWMQCRKVFALPLNESMDIFENPPVGDERYVKRTAKCLADCTMRKDGVMSDDGLDEAKYIVQIMQLRYNYTTFDIMKKSSEEKEKIWDTISKRASLLTSYEMRPNDLYRHFKCRNMSPFRNHCYDLIRSYVQAVRNCKNLKDPKDDDCETSWMIMRCIMEENRKRSFDGPFYPIRLLNYYQDHTETIEN